MKSIEQLKAIDNKYNLEIQRCNEALFRFIDKQNSNRYSPEEKLAEAGQAILRQNNVISSMKADMLEIINEFSNYLLERSTQNGESFDQIKKDAKDLVHALNLKEENNTHGE